MRWITTTVLLWGIALIVFSSVLSLAQVMPLIPAPSSEAGVVGTGTIQFGDDDTIGALDINVGATGRLLTGGLQFSETNSANERGNVIYSTTVVTLDVQGNSATVTAEGYWNNMPSHITLQVIDDNINGDWYRIIAQPLYVDVVYEATGVLVLGDLALFIVPPPDSYASGLGAVAVDGGIGRFDFNITEVNGYISGNLVYNESLSRVSPMRRRASIYLAVTEDLSVSGIEGVVFGTGRLNGVPATIEVRVLEWSRNNGMPDEFYIRATPLGVNSWNMTGYQAGGQLVAGQVQVGILTPINP